MLNLLMNVCLEEHILQNTSCIIHVYKIILRIKKVSPFPHIIYLNKKVNKIITPQPKITQLTQLFIHISYNEELGSFHSSNEKVVSLRFFLNHSAFLFTVFRRLTIRSTVSIDRFLFVSFVYALDNFLSLTISKMDMDIEFCDLSLRDNEDFYKNGVLFFGAVNYLTLDRFNRVLGRYSLRFGTAV